MEVADRKYSCAIIEANDEESIKTVSEYIRFGGGEPVFVAPRRPPIEESDEEGEEEEEEVEEGLEEDFLGDGLDYHYYLEGDTLAL